MTPEQQREVIAELCGKDPNEMHWYFDENGKRVELWPDYLNNWNAMHAAVNTLSLEDRMAWITWMDKLTADPNDKLDQSWLPLRFLRATCATWAEAFLRALNRWEES